MGVLLKVIVVLILMLTLVIVVTTTSTFIVIVIATSWATIKLSSIASTTLESAPLLLLQDFCCIDPKCDLSRDELDRACFHLFHMIFFHRLGLQIDHLYQNVLYDGLCVGIFHRFVDVL